MNKLFVLTFLGLVFCSTVYAQDTWTTQTLELEGSRQGRSTPVLDAMTAQAEPQVIPEDTAVPEEVEEADEAEEALTPEEAMELDAPVEAIAPKAVGGGAGGLRIKEKYRGGKMTQWQLYDGNGNLLTQIKYSNFKPILLQVFDGEGNPQESEFSDTYPNGTPRIVATFKKGVQTTTTGYYENGQVRYKLKKARNGKTVHFREYAENGKPKDGDYKEYYPSGKIKGMGNFRRGLPDGNFVSFCEDGTIVAEKEFKRGRLESQSMGRVLSCEDTFAYLDSGIRPFILVAED